MQNSEQNLAVLVSGGGSTAQRICQAYKTGELVGIRPRLVISSRADAGAIPKVIAEGIPPEDVVVVRRRDFATPTAFGEALLREFDKRQIYAVAQCGWMAKTPVNVIEKLQGFRIFNQHPGPLDPGYPDFGGQGMMGRAVHYAVLEFAKRSKHSYKHETAVFTHFLSLDEEYDRGLIVGAVAVPFELDWTPEQLAAKTLPFEHQLVIETINLYPKGGPYRLEQSTRMIHEDEYGLLEEIKAEARVLYPHG